MKDQHDDTTRDFDTDPAHAPGKQRMGPPPEQAERRSQRAGRRREHQPWMPTSGLVGRIRRSARRG